MVAIPVVAAVLIALMALLLMYGLKEFGKAIAQIFPSSIGVSVASIHPRAWVMAGVDALEAGIAWVLGDVIRPMVNLVLGPVVSVIQFVESLDTALARAADGFEWVVTDGLPALRAGLVGLISAVETSVKRVALALYQDAVALLSAVESRLIALISAVETAVEHYALSLYHDAVGLISAVESRVLGELSAVEAHLQDQVVGLVKSAEADLIGEVDQLAGTVKADLTQALDYAESEAGKALTAAEAYAVTAATAAVGVLVTDVDQAVAPVVTGLIDDIGSVVGVIGSDFPDVGSLLRDLDLSKLGEMAGALAGTMTIVQALTRLAEDCTIPNCRNLSGVGRALQDLFALVEGGSLLALIAALITDPEGTATELHQVLDPIVSDGINAARSTLGV